MNETTKTRSGLTIRAARAVPARPEAAYRAFTDPTVCRTWWGKTDKVETTGCDIDLRVGGGLRFERRTANGAAGVTEGKFVEVYPPHKLAFTWMAGPAVETYVTMDFFDMKDGSTRIVITHEGLPNPQTATMHSAGWHNFLQDMSLHFVGV